MLPNIFSQTTIVKRSQNLQISSQMAELTGVPSGCLCTHMYPHVPPCPHISPTAPMPTLMSCYVPYIPYVFPICSNISPSMSPLCPNIFPSMSPLFPSMFPLYPIHPVFDWLRLPTTANHLHKILILSPRIDEIADSKQASNEENWSLRSPTRSANASYQKLPVVCVVFMIYVTPNDTWLKAIWRIYVVCLLTTNFMSG